MRATTAIALVAGLLGAGLLAPALPAAPAQAATSYANYYVADSIRTTTAQTTVALGTPGDRPVVGDPNGDGLETIALQRGTTVLRHDDPTNPVRTGSVTIPSGYDAYYGDWDGDGTDTLALHQRGTSRFLVTDRPDGTGLREVIYGRARDEVHIGDWDGDGDDTFGLRRGTTFYLKNEMSGGPADVTFTYGRPDDVVHVGNWDGRGGQTLAVRRGNVFHFKNSFTGGVADSTLPYGRSTDGVLIGDWSGDGREAPAVRRVESTAVPTTVSPKISDAFAQAVDAGLATPAPSTVDQVTTAVRFLSDPIHHYSSDASPYELNVVSALAPLRAYVTATEVGGRDVQLQMSEDGGHTWTAVWRRDPANRSATWVSQFVDMPAVNRGRDVTRRYRVLVGAGNGEGAITSTPQEIVHQDPRAFAPGSVEERMYQQMKPYCPAVPLRFVGSDDSDFLEHAGVDRYAGMAYMSGKDLRLHQMIQFAEEYRDPTGWNNYSYEQWMLHLALHECGHVIDQRMQYTTDSARSSATAYPFLSSGERAEAIADQLARHWTLKNPGANRSAYFTAASRHQPYADVTSSKRYRGGVDMTTYTGDDAYIADLTTFALREASAYR